LATKLESAFHLETAHVLFVDVVGYSKLLVTEQREVVQTLNQIVRTTPQFRKSEANGDLIRIPVGDGMALVFFQTPEEPALCAMEIATALKKHPGIQLRMGINSGPVDRLRDVNNQANVAGAGINIAQRVMALGDAGHILMTRRVAADLAEDTYWHDHLHDLGEVELKHDLKVGLVNLYTEELGNSQPPEKVERQRKEQRSSGAMRSATAFLGSRIGQVVILFLLAVVGIGLWKLRNSNHPIANPARPSDKSIAVLPFENLSADPQNAFFADGVQDEILTDLAKIADLKVISRTSVMQYKTAAKRNVREIAKDLGVAHVLEGSVQRTGNRVRVSAQLIDSRTDTHLWAEHYDRDLADVFAIQSEIAKTIAGQLEVRISPGEKAEIERVPTRDLAAYDFYVQAQALWGDVSDPIHAREKLPQAARLLDQAVTHDPQFLLAWCLLSKTHGALYKQGYDHTPARLNLANVAVQTALRLEPNAGETHLALASYYYYGLRDFESVRKELAIARRTLPNNPEIFEYAGFMDRREGRWEEATHNLEEALELDPRNLFLLQQLALTYPSQRRYREETQIWDRMLTIVPGDPLTRVSRAQVAFHWKADLKPYIETLNALLAENRSVGPDVDLPSYAVCERNALSAERSLKNYPSNGAINNGVNVPRAYWEGVVARAEGNAAAARAAFLAARDEVAKSVDNHPDFAAALSLLGVIDAGLDRKQEALREGRRACELLPVSKDAVDGVVFATNLAQIYAWIGEKDLAIEQIAAVERVPNRLSYGVLKLDPDWDSLRGDPRFEKIVASLAPKS
jgi:TolB-like protein/class 3 adenylate cyclase/Flp pilus assembly protein TadD